MLISCPRNPVDKDKCDNDKARKRLNTGQAQNNKDNEEDNYEIMHRRRSWEEQQQELKLRSSQERRQQQQQTQQETTPATRSGMTPNRSRSAQQNTAGMEELQHVCTFLWGCVLSHRPPPPKTCHADYHSPHPKRWKRFKLRMTVRTTRTRHRPGWGWGERGGPLGWI